MPTGVYIRTEIYRNNMSKAMTGKKRSLEHILPLSRGGTNEYSNLVIACRHCNSSKRQLTKEEFLEKGQGVPLA